MLAIILSSLIFFYTAIICFWIFSTKLSAGRVFFSVTSPVVLAGCVYLFSHVLRALRLMVLLVDRERSFLAVFRLHFALSWISALLPFKIGDFCRMLEVSHLQRQTMKGPFVIIIERFFDGVILLGFSLLSLIIEPDMLPDMARLVILYSMVVSFAALSYHALPGTLDFTRSLIIRRSTSQRGITWLNVIAGLSNLVTEIRSLIFGRALIIFMLSVLIWGMEWCCLSFVYHYASHESVSFVWLSLVPNVFSFFLGATDNVELMTVACLYKSIVFLMLSLIGFPAIFSYSVWRAKNSIVAIRECTNTKRHYHLNSCQFSKKN